MGSLHALGFAVEKPLAPLADDVVELLMADVIFERPVAEKHVADGVAERPVADDIDVVRT